MSSDKPPSDESEATGPDVVPAVADGAPPVPIAVAAEPPAAVEPETPAEMNPALADASPDAVAPTVETPIVVAPPAVAATMQLVEEELFVDGGPVKLHLVGRTDVGLVREHNEDNFACVRLEDDSRDVDALLHHHIAAPGTLLVVCDGMGGAAAGEVASTMAVATLPEVMRAAHIPAPPAGVVDDERSMLARKLRHAAEEANRRIFLEQQANPARAGMGTTMTAALLRGDQAIIAQVGDSRCYIYRAGRLVQCTRDQSLVNQLLETGQITVEQAKYFEHSNVILQALGVQEDVEVQLSRVTLRRGDRILLCSDGLVGVIADEEIAAVMGSVADPAEAARLLIELANGAGGPDNITVVLGYLSGAGLLEPGEDDNFTYSTWHIDPEPPTPTEALAPEPVVVVEHLPPPARSAGPAISSMELFSMCAIVGLIAGSLVFGSALYKRAVPCEVRATRAGMVVTADGRDSGARTIEGSVALRLRPGRHSLGLALPKRTTAPGVGEPVVPHQDIEVTQGQACVVSFDEPTAGSAPETVP
ncbi:MAG: Stp1/IreP family PP2C-type Ser/Thr phosphatase [Polyangia bacterium]